MHAISMIIIHNSQFGLIRTYCILNTISNLSNIYMLLFIVHFALSSLIELILFSLRRQTLSRNFACYIHDNNLKDHIYNQSQTSDSFSRNFAYAISMIITLKIMLEVEGSFVP